MIAPASSSRAARPASTPLNGHLSAGTFDIRPSGRIGPPLVNARRRAVKRFAILILAAGAGWLLLADETRRSWLISKSTSLVAAMLEQQTKQPPAPPAEATPPSLPPVEQANAASAPPASESAPQVANVESVEPPSRIDAEPPQPLPPPRVSPNNPYQVRAMAVGLHPEISRAVLEALSETDFQNAGIAIRTALEQTPDGAEYVWPRQREPRQALFKVHFVQGAPADCRRYVVTVVREGWSTTALPMEKCGIRSKPLKRK